MFLISATFNMGNYEDIMKRYYCKALSAVERAGDDVCVCVCFYCMCVSLKIC